MTEARTPGFELSGEAQPLSGLLGEIWRARGLILMLGRKDFFVRYRRASFGILWAVGLPLIQAIVLAIVFSRVVRIETGTNFPTFLFAGLIPFTFFSQTLSQGVTSIVRGQDLASKIYFPRAVFPLALVVTSTYAIPANLLVLGSMAVFFGVGLDPLELLWLAPAMALLLALSASFALVLAALQVYFRDMQYVVAAVLTALFYASPVIYPLDLAPPGLRTILLINPIAGVIEMFRAAIVGADPGWLTAVLSSLCWTVALLVFALFLYRRFNRVFVDLM